MVSDYSLTMNRTRASSRQRRKPSRTSGHDRQASLISAATSLFSANGFTGTTAKQIAKAAGVTEALLFKYFPTKHVQYTAILAEKTQYSELREAVEAATNEQDDERLFTLLASDRLRKGADLTMICLPIFSALEGHELPNMFFQQQYRVFHDLLAGYI